MAWRLIVQLISAYGLSRTWGLVGLRAEGLDGLGGGGGRGRTDVEGRGGMYKSFSRHRQSAHLNVTDRMFIERTTCAGVIGHDRTPFGVDFLSEEAVALLRRCSKTQTVALICSIILKTLSLALLCLPRQSPPIALSTASEIPSLKPN